MADARAAVGRIKSADHDVRSAKPQTRRRGPIRRAGGTATPHGENGGVSSSAARPPRRQRRRMVGRRAQLLKQLVVRGRVSIKFGRSAMATARRPSAQTGRSSAVLLER